MSGFIKFFSFAVALLAVFVGYIFYHEWQSAEKTAKISCLGSVASAAGEAGYLKRIKPNEKSRELTKEEIADLIKTGKIGDCGGKDYIFETLHIAIGEVNKTSNAPIRVWIDGNDGISGTKDDVIFPWEENAQ
jgi:hypothetical protein